MIFPRSKKTRQSIAHTVSPVHEKKLAKALKGHRVRGSGCGSEKGDVRVKGICRIELKTTSKLSFRVDRKIIDKIQNSVIGTGEIPCIVVEFIDGNGKILDSVSVIKTIDLKRLLDR